MSTNTHDPLGHLDQLRQYIKSTLPLKHGLPMDLGETFIGDANSLLGFGKWEDCGSDIKEAFAALYRQSAEAASKLENIGLAYNADKPHEVMEHFKDHTESHVYYPVYQIGCPYHYKLWLVVSGRTYKDKLESRSMLTNVKGK